MRERILVVDDDRDICRLVKMYLENESFEVDVAYSGEEALALLGYPGPSGASDRNFGTPFSGIGRGSCAIPRSCAMLILDIMLPGIDGFEVARQARTRTDVPILFLTARDADVDKAIGLGIGADDYVTKPFSPMELVARVKAHLRR
ncbi:MAG: response regulator [Bacillota bacterium]